MSAIWHDYGEPSFMGGAPNFSFLDVAEIVAPAPEAYAEARKRMQRWELKMGIAYYKHNAELAHKFFQMKKPWYL